MTQREGLLEWIGAMGGPSTTSHTPIIQMGRDLEMHSWLDFQHHSHGFICQEENACYDANAIYQHLEKFDREKKNKVYGKI